MARGFISTRALASFARPRTPRFLSLSFGLLGLALAVTALFATPPVADAAVPTMCGLKVEHRTQTVFIDTGDPAVTGLTRADAFAAIDRWNELFRRYHGIDIFTPYEGNWQDADILVTATGPNTWVRTACDRGYQQRGNNKSILFVGSANASLNATWFVHELGHTLGFPDYTDSPRAGHIAPQACGSYMGVMSYCTAPQSWMLDIAIPGFVVDGDLVRDYWN